MNIRSEILKEHSKPQALKIAKWIGKDASRFKELMDLFLFDEYRVVQRSAWIVSSCAENHPELIKPWMKKMLLKTQEKNVHDAVKRNVMRILQFVEIPKSLQGLAADIAFQFLANKNEAVAIRVFSMTVLLNLTHKEPDLKQELRLLIEENIPYEKAAFKSRGRNVLKSLSK